MPKTKPVVESSGSNTMTLILVAFLGGLIAVALQPLIIIFYARIGLSTESIYQQPSPIPTQTMISTTIVTTTIESIQQTATTTTRTTTKTTTVATPLNDPTVDEEPIILKNEPIKIELTPTSSTKTTTATTTTTTTKTPSKEERRKNEKREERPKSEKKKKKSEESPQLIDVTGRTTEIPDEVKNFKSTRINMIQPKKLWIPIPGSNGGHRRVPPISIRPGKEHTTSIKHWLFEEFLSKEECTNLIKVHKEHVQKMKEIDPIICFDSIQTLRKYLNDLQPDSGIFVTPNDFTQGTTCVNATFSSKLKEWGLKWSYSTAFYPGESPFSKILAKRIEDGTALQGTHGGKFQITSTEKGVGYKSHRDCTLDGLKQDRYATFLVYLNTVMEGGETEFQDLEIKIKPKEGRAVVWNNMNEEGECEEKSLHSANIVGDEEGKFVLQRWYYYENFYSLGRRPPEPDEPERLPGQARVSCDEYDMGSCRAYDEWNYDHLLKYRHIHHNLI